MSRSLGSFGVKPKKVKYDGFTTSTEENSSSNVLRIDVNTLNVQSLAVELSLNILGLSAEKYYRMTKEDTLKYYNDWLKLQMNSQKAIALKIIIKHKFDNNYDISNKQNQKQEQKMIPNASVLGKYSTTNHVIKPYVINQNEKYNNYEENKTNFKIEQDITPLNYKTQFNQLQHKIKQLEMQLDNKNLNNIKKTITELNSTVDNSNTNYNMSLNPNYKNHDKKIIQDQNIFTNVQSPTDLESSAITDSTFDLDTVVNNYASKLNTCGRIKFRR